LFVLDIFFIHLIFSNESVFIDHKIDVALIH